VADVVRLQSAITTPEVLHLRAANTVVRKAKKYREGCGLYFPYLQPPLALRVFHDSSHATKTTSYAQEAVLVLLTTDYDISLPSQDHKLTDSQVSALSGGCHAVATISRKAKRVSYGTSQAETGAAIVGKELGQMVALRYTEVLSYRHFTLPAMIAVQETNAFVFPIDQLTDCQDLFENAAGEKTLPQDKTHRLYILSLREERLTHGMRYWIKIPTEWMLCDAMTKSMISQPLLNLLRTGNYQIKNVLKKVIRIKSVPLITVYDETDLINLKEFADAAERDQLQRVKGTIYWYDDWY
jgi:hypothetical protein